MIRFNQVLENVEAEHRSALARKDQVRVVGWLGNMMGRVMGR